MTGNGDLGIRIVPHAQQSPLTIGASVACSGICLTVVGLSGEGRTGFDVRASTETRERTNVGSWTVGAVVNLERPVRVGDELGGHIVSGHVDGVARLVTRTAVEDSERFELEFPPCLARFIAVKGSIALDGVSLTVNEVRDNRLAVNVIPHTLNVTTLGNASLGAELNIEADAMARYVDRILQFRR